MVREVCRRRYTERQIEWETKRRIETRSRDRDRQREKQPANTDSQNKTLLVYEFDCTRKTNFACIKQKPPTTTSPQNHHYMEFFPHSVHDR